MRAITFAKFTAGDGFRSTVEVRDPQTQTLFDPTVIVLRLKNPAGTETAITPVRLSVGVYEATGVFDMEGTWYRQWKVSGVTEGVDEETINVSKSQFTQ
jgi:hypothetical protein